MAKIFGFKVYNTKFFPTKVKDNGDGTFTYIDCNQTWEGELKENKVRGRVEVRREKKVKDCKFYTPY